MLGVCCWIGQVAGFCSDPHPLPQVFSAGVLIQQPQRVCLYLATQEAVRLRRERDVQDMKCFQRFAFG